MIQIFRVLTVLLLTAAVVVVSSATVATAQASGANAPVRASDAGAPAQTAQGDAAAADPVPASEQPAVPIGIDYPAWERTALRAEEAIEAGRASDSALNGLRDELSGWRAQFASAQSANAKTIATVRGQIAGLGTPAEGAEEPADIAAQRAALNARLVVLRAPVTAAEVAQSRAEGLIDGIDEILRERQANALVARGPTPFNPSLWTRGWAAFLRSLNKTRNEVGNAWFNEVQRQEFADGLPAITVLGGVGLILLLLGRGWMVRLAGSVQARRPTPTRWLTVFILSLGQVFVPLFGLAAIIEAFYASQLVGLRMDPILSQMRAAGLDIFIALWLGGRVFPRDEVEHRPLHLSIEQRRAGRLCAGLIGFVLAARRILDEFSSYDAWSDGVRAVVYFPVILLAGLLLWQLGQLLKIHGNAALSDSGETASYTDRMYRLLGRALVVFAWFGPVLAGLGYLTAAMNAVFPALSSLLLLAFVLVLQRFFAEIYVLMRRDPAARDGLVPVLAGIVLVTLAAPVFALFWGVSDTRLLELWQSAREGFTVGDTTISVGDFLTFAVVFTIGFTLTRLVQGAMKNTVLPKTRMDAGGQTALVSGIGYIGIFLAALIAITSAGINLSSIALVAGALSVGIGFGLQTVVSNFVSGIILLIERPISEGDWIEVGGQMGYVRDISVRSTRIETFDRTDVIVPNSDLVSGTVTNYTRGNTVGRVIVPVGVAYGSDTRRIEEILLEVGKAHPMVLATPAPYVVFQGFGADSLDFEIRAILRDVNWVLSVRSDMNHEIARRFAEEGIEIPFAQRDIWLRNPEALQRPGTEQGGATHLARTVPEEGPETNPEAGSEAPHAQGTGRQHLASDDMDGGPEGDGEGGDR
ncbi:MAG: mechanosensitive ion channel protein MscS [Rhodobacterales bacterium]|nr:MAG: mechanosensitive ion channel protein MscS [Rhodobacterales bacterium]